MYRILVADPLDASGLEILRSAETDVHVLTTDERDKLPELLATFDALIVRSMTKVTADLLRAGRRLKVVRTWKSAQAPTWTPSSSAYRTPSRELVCPPAAPRP